MILRDLEDRSRLFGFLGTPELTEMMAVVVAHRSKLAGVPVSTSAIVRSWIEAALRAEYDAITTNERRTVDQNARQA